MAATVPSRPRPPGDPGGRRVSGVAPPAAGARALAEYSRRVLSPRRPASLFAAAVLVCLQGLVIVAFGGYLAVEGVVGDPSSVVNAEIAGALALLAGAGLLAVARGIGRGRRWSRSPAALTQVLSLPVGWGLVQGGRPEIGLPVIAVAVATLVLLFLPASNASFEG